MSGRRLLAALALAAPLAACTGGGTGGVSFPPGEQVWDAGARPPITDYITGAQSIDGALQAALLDGPPPISRSRAPEIALLAGGFTIPGGSKLVGVNAGTAQFVRVVLAVDGATGWYDLGGLVPGSFGSFVFSVAQTAPASFTARVAAVSPPESPDCAECGIGPYQPLAVNLTSVGTGDVQVSLAWDTGSDLDLHVVEPGGAEIFYGARLDAATGGTLDLDSNAGCAYDGKDNENVTWKGGQPPRGQYTVRVDNWDGCRQGLTHYAVTVNVRGQGTRLWVGTFNGLGDQGGLGAGVEVGRFDY